MSEISSVTSLWETLTLVNDEETINLSRAKVYAFSDSVWCLAKVRQGPESNEDLKTKLNCLKG